MDTPMISRIEAAERYLKLARELAILAVGLYLALLLLPAAPALARNLSGLRVSEVEALGIKARLEEAQRSVQSALGPAQPVADAKADIPSTTTVQLYQALDKLNALQRAVDPLIEPARSGTPAALGGSPAPATAVLAAGNGSVTTPTSAGNGTGNGTGNGAGGTYWVYLGELRGSSLRSDSFALTGVPEVGTQLVAKTSLNKRRTAPVERDGVRYMGEPLGVVSEGAALVVVALDRGQLKEGTEAVWAKVRPAS